MANILCSPSKYVQGAGEMKKLGEYAQELYKTFAPAPDQAFVIGEGLSDMGEKGV